MIPSNIMQYISEQPGPKNFLLDCGCMIIPYLKYNLYTWNRTNITPFIRTLELYMYLTDKYRSSKFFIAIDNGVPEKIMSMYPAYKGNRKKSSHRREDKILARDVLKSNEYVVNRTLIAQFFTYVGAGVVYFNEADYQLGYILKELLEKYEQPGQGCYVISHDKDLMALIDYCNCIRKLHVQRERSVKYWLYPRGDYMQFFEQDAHVYNYEEFIVHKALQGDRGDNILAPIMIKESVVKKLFSDWKFKYGHPSLNLEQAYSILLDKVVHKALKKVDDSQARTDIEHRLAMEMRRNYIIFDVYNAQDLFTPVDRKMISTIVQNVMDGTTKNYQQALNLLKRVSSSHAEIFINYVNRGR